MKSLLCSASVFCVLLTTPIFAQSSDDLPISVMAGLARAGSADSLTEALEGRNVPEQLSEELSIRAQITLLEAFFKAGEGSESASEIATTLLKFSPTNRVYLALNRTPIIQEDSETPPLDNTATVSAPADPAHVLGAIRRNSALELVNYILSQAQHPTWTEETTLDAIGVLERYVRPLPASNAEANWKGYLALTFLDEGNQEYGAKATQYEAAYESQRMRAVDRLVTERDEFNDVTFYLHPNKPRYEDTRSYLQPYLAQSSSGRVTLRFRLNYTADSWLFVDNAAFNIDGRIVRLPSSLRWNRDNDTEIWEWVDIVATRQQRQMLEDVANSAETIVRFNGRQYYNNVTIRAADKQSIREILLAEEVLNER